MKKLLLICLILCGVISFGQNKKTDIILEEGKLLYRLEKGSWYGTDDMLSRFSSKRDSIGGYVSYEGSDKKVYTVFFNKFNPDEILIRYQFDHTPNTKPINIDTTNRISTELEKDLIAISMDARKRVFENVDEFFTFYENTSFNFIPIINKNKKKVFLLTGPQESGVVIIGNDYVLNYNKTNMFKNIKKIHNSILQFPYKSEDKENPIESTFHSHVVEDYISSTDICTLLLYRDFVEWNQHIVIGDKEVSIFNLDK
ncbi:MAG TPA: hypothetical protein VFD80_06120, partial [Flavobacteriaceae bacterium]|nr:hypothetical protein [Flavobacteriaceae bacterium]